MNENLIFEGNTIYEIDPVCIKNKNIQNGNDRRPGSREMTGKMKKTSDLDRCTDEILQSIKIILLLQWAGQGKSH